MTLLTDAEIILPVNGYMISTSSSAEFLIRWRIPFMTIGASAREITTDSTLPT
ncbi:MAG: hypothetical protein AB8C46_23205 [Burkholderiaceae bacterium]